uniref:Uncharacterized protein n=1 Tax=Pinguiococcus pyrenoidosus TaxID=172671 RepID=A0A7R9U6T7_9STRA|mmetsp:Transcript_17221/g.65717  ORF Transcript_17221/g.65717 Transcript_17221/m.65717 type:complete len:197 (+) Transcript_17221:85-675(+)
MEAQVENPAAEESGAVAPVALEGRSVEFAESVSGVEAPEAVLEPLGPSRLKEMDSGAMTVPLDWSCGVPGHQDAIQIEAFCAAAEGLGQRLHGLCWNLQDSALVWLSTGPVVFGNLAAAFPSRFDEEPLSTGILRGQSDGMLAEIAVRLSRRAGMPVFVSGQMNEAELDRAVLMACEKEILRIIQQGQSESTADEQ